MVLPCPTRLPAPLGPPLVPVPGSAWLCVTSWKTGLGLLPGSEPFGIPRNGQRETPNLGSQFAFAAPLADFYGCMQIYGGHECLKSGRSSGSQQHSSHNRALAWCRFGTCPRDELDHHLRQHSWAQCPRLGGATITRQRLCNPPRNTGCCKTGFSISHSSRKR